MWNDLDPPDFRPWSWLRNPHVQTVVPTLGSTRRYVETGRQHHVELEDGDQIVLHDDCPPSWQPGQMVALLVHGLGGSHRSPYLLRMADKLTRYGHRAIRMDLRGHGAGMHLARHLGHAGRSSDLLAVIHYVRQLAPDSTVGVVGVSMGGNILLKLLGELGTAAESLVRVAVAVAPPIDIAACAETMKRRSRALYNRNFTKLLNKHLREMQRLELTSAELGPPAGDLWEFDARYTAPLSGFADIHDYYRQSSAARLVDKIRVPTVLLTARDDPIVPDRVFDDLSIPPAMQLIRTDYGGHVGYMGHRGDDPDGYWMEWRVIEWLTGRRIRCQQPHAATATARVTTVATATARMATEPQR